MNQMEDLEARVDQLRLEGAWSQVASELQGYAVLAGKHASESSHKKNTFSNAHPSADLARAYYWTVMAECHLRKQNSSIPESLQCLLKGNTYFNHYQDSNIIIAELLLFQAGHVPTRSCATSDFIPHSKLPNRLHSLEPKKRDDNPWDLILQRQDKAVNEVEEGYETAEEETEEENENQSAAKKMVQFLDPELASLFEGVQHQYLCTVEKIFESVQETQKQQLFQILHVVSMEARLNSVQVFFSKYGPECLQKQKGQTKFSLFTKFVIIVAVQILKDIEGIFFADSSSKPFLSTYRRCLYLWGLVEKGRLLELVGNADLAVQAYEIALRAASPGPLPEDAAVFSLLAGHYAGLPPFCAREVVLAASSIPLVLAQEGKTQLAIGRLAWCLDSKSMMYELLNLSDKAQLAQDLALLLDNDSSVQALEVLCHVCQQINNHLGKRHHPGQAKEEVTAQEKDNEDQLSQVLVCLSNLTGHHLVSLGQYKEAILLFESILGSDAVLNGVCSMDCAVQWWHLAKALAANQQFTQAFNALDESERILLGQVNVHSSLPRHTESNARISINSEHLPTFFPALQAAQISLRLVGNIERAVNFARHAVELLQTEDENDARPYYYLGLCLAKKAQSQTPFAQERKNLQKEALAAFEEAFRQKENGPAQDLLPVFVHQAVLLGELGKPGDAFKHCEYGLQHCKKGLAEHSWCQSAEVALLHTAALALGCTEEKNFELCDKFLCDAMRKLGGYDCNLALSRACLALHFGESEFGGRLLGELCANIQVEAQKQISGNKYDAQRKNKHAVAQLQRKPMLMLEFCSVYIDYLLSQSQLDEASKMVQQSNMWAAHLIGNSSKFENCDASSESIQAEVLCQSGTLQSARSDFVAAEKSFQLALMHDQHHILSLVRLAALYVRRANPEWTDLLSNQYQWPFFSRVMETQHQLHHRPEAMDVGTNEYKPGSALKEYQSNMKDSDWTKAYNLLSETIRRDPSCYQAWHYLGMIFEVANMPLESAETYLAALDSLQVSSPRRFSHIYF